LTLQKNVDKSSWSSWLSISVGLVGLVVNFDWIGGLILASQKFFFGVRRLVGLIFESKGNEEQYKVCKYIITMRL